MAETVNKVCQWQTDYEKGETDMEVGIMQNNKWNIALGLIKVDGLKPTQEFLTLTEREQRGEITTNDIRNILNQKYRVKNDA